MNVSLQDRGNAQEEQIKPPNHNALSFHSIQYFTATVHCQVSISRKKKQLDNFKQLQ